MSRRRDGRGVGGGDIFWKSGRGGVVLGAVEHGSIQRGNERKPMCWVGGVGNAAGTLVAESLGVLAVCYCCTGYLGRDGPTSTPPAGPRCRREVRRARGLVIHRQLYYACVSSGYCPNLERENTSAACITAAALLLLAG